MSGDTETAEATIPTNLPGPIRISAALLSNLMARRGASIFMVTSGLAYVPKVLAPTYCATKAGIRSYAQTLRCQLKGTSVQVIELVPPYTEREDRYAKTFDIINH